MKKFFFLIVLFAFSLLLVSCQDNSDVTYTYTGCEITFTDDADFGEQRDIKNLLDASNVNATLTLKADGTYELKNGDKVETGTYTKTDTSVELKSGDITQTGTIEKTTVKFTISGSSYISEKVKKLVFVYDSKSSK